MVYKIRSKTFFQTLSGYKNNYHVQVLNDVAPANSEITYALKTFSGAPNFVRVHQLYRNLSRKAKQYLYGNKDQEEKVVMWLRKAFTVPLTCETPVHLIQSEPIRRFANQGDRDYELMSYNSHPYQLHVYNSINKDIEWANDLNERQAAGDKTLEEQFADIFEEKMQELEKSGRASAMSWFNVHEVLEEVLTKYKVAQGSAHPRRADGSFGDVLEARRPNAQADPATNASIKTQ